MIQFTYTPHPAWLIGGGLVVLLLFWLSFRKAKGRPTGKLKVALITLRILAIVAVVICILDPQWVETIKHQAQSRVALLLDTSRSMSIQDVPGGRLTAARDWVEKKVQPVVPANIHLSSYSFDHVLGQMPNLKSSSPTGAVTELADALESLLTVPANDPLTGVILISDGIETSNADPERVARIYRRKGIPIHTVLVGTTNEVKDVVLEDIQVKRAVPNEAPTRVTLRVRSPGFASKKVAVQVRGDKGLVASKDILLTGATQNIEIEVTPRQKGFQVYEASVSPQAGEWLTSNNKRLFGLEVVDPTIHVIYMEGTPQHASSPVPEWRYLKAALESDPNIKVKTLYRQRGNSGQLLHTIDTDPRNGEKIYPVEHPTLGFPKTMAGLLDYDVVIHSDIRKESFSGEQLQNMAKLVEEHGGGFVMVGGNSAFGKGGYHKTILDRIIPVAMEQSNDSQSRSLRMRIPLAALSHPIMNIGSTREETELIWGRKFPTLYGWNRVDYAKPGAMVLGEDPTAANQYGPGLVLAVQEIGKGRSMAFTSDTTRSWGRDFETLWGEPIRPGAVSEGNCDSRYYRQFWVNAVRWLASGKLGRTNNAVTLELAHTYTRPNQAVEARIKVRDTELRDVSNADISLFVSLNGKTNAPIKARFDNAQRAYVASIPAPTEGKFIVRAVAQRQGLSLGDDRQLLVSESEDAEMADVRARPEVLAAIARNSGGKTHSVSDGGSPAYVFTEVPPPTLEYRRKPVWDKFGWMALILTLLGTEWALRRIRGLA